MTDQTQPEPPDEPVAAPIPTRRVKIARDGIFPGVTGEYADLPVDVASQWDVDAWVRRG